MKFMKPVILVGNTGGIFTNKYTATDFAQMLYQAFPDESIYGLFDFRKPQYILRDPDSIKQIAVKDFEHFEDHQPFADKRIETVYSSWKIETTISLNYRLKRYVKVKEIIATNATGLLLLLPAPTFSNMKKTHQMLKNQGINETLQV